MKKFKKLFATLFLASVMTAGVTACGVTPTSSETSEEVSSSSVAEPTYALSLTADKKTAKPGEKVTLTATLTADGEKIEADDVEFEFLAGAESAKLKNNVLTISSDAKANDVITVIAKIGATKSESVSITVDVPLEKVEISANGVTNVRSGGSVSLTKTITPANADASAFKWTITEGSKIATMNGDVLVVSESAKTGDKITVKGAIGDKEDTLSFIVGYPLEKLTVTVQGSANIPAGQTVNLIVEKLPANTTNGSYTWVEVANGDYFTIENDKLIISADAPDNSEIQFKAVSEDGVESGVITVTIGIAIEALTIDANLPEVLAKGESYTVTLIAQPMAASTRNVEWVFNDEAKAYIDGHFNIANNTYTFTVSEEIPSGTPLTIKAVSGTISYEIKNLQVGIALESISLTMNGSKNVDPGAARVLNVSYNPTNATDKEVSWIFTEGESLCTIVNNVLTVNEGVEIGNKISFKASVAGIESAETIEIIVGTPIESIVIADDSDSNEIVKGESVNLFINKVTPEGAKLDSITWSIIEGDTYASFDDNKLVVSSEAITGSTIKVVATSGDAVSNELVFTVMPTKEEINASKYLLSLSEDQILFDKNAESAPVLVADVYDGNGTQIFDKTVNFMVTKGDALLEISYENGVCTFTEALGHGEAEITVIVDGTALTETMDVIVIVPPEDINLPEVFTGKERGNYTYNFSMQDSLPFVATPTGTKVCQDVTYLFAHEDGTTGAEVATYANGQITFKKTGKITVTASSNSGSRIETTKAYSFNINNGKNVYTFEELKSHLEYTYDGVSEINIVALNKITGPKMVVSNVNAETGVGTYSQSGTKDYGYALVPAIALGSIENQTFDALYNRKSPNLLVSRKGLHLNANNHSIDVSQIRPLTKAEMEEGHKANGNAIDSDYFTCNLFQFWPGDVTESFNVNIYDLKIIGNTPIDFAGDIVAGTAKAIGVPLSGIAIGFKDCPNAHFRINMKNVSVEGFQHGINITNAVDSVLENVTAQNCYTDGIVCRSSIITLRDITLANCGATGIEFAPEDCNQAGLNRNQNQTITIDGKISSLGMLSDGTTRYFNNYDSLGVSVPYFINALLEAYGFNADQISNMRNSNGQFAVIALLFNNLSAMQTNTTEINYPSDMEGGIVTAFDPTTYQYGFSGVDTTHQYIRLPLMTGSTPVGSVLLYNLNYKG